MPKCDFNKVERTPLFLRTPLDSCFWNEFFGLSYFSSPKENILMILNDINVKSTTDNETL